MCRAGEAIQYRIGDRRVVDEGMPVFDRQLTTDNGCAFADTVVQELQQIMLAGRFEFTDAKIVKDREVGAFILSPQPCRTAIYVGELKRLQKAGNHPVRYADAVSNSLHPQTAPEPCFSRFAFARDQDVLVPACEHGLKVA